jgi:DNA-directed RNA polymerase subunit RPC12/RpoP
MAEQRAWIREMEPTEEALACVDCGQRFIVGKRRKEKEKRVGD